MQKRRRSHVVVFSTLEQGHLIPAFQTTLHLAHRGVAVTFVTTPLNATALAARLPPPQSPLLLHFHHLSLPSFDGLPPDQESCHTLHPKQFQNLYLATEQLQPQFEGLLQSLALNADEEWMKPTCVIGDMFTGWVQESAMKMGIPGFTFYTSPAYGTLLYNSLWLHLPHLDNQSDTVTLPDVPTFLTLNRSDLTPSLLKATRSNPWHLFVSRQVKKNRHTRGYIVNTFLELEPEIIEYMETSSGKPVWTVGPVLPYDYIAGSSVTTPLDRGEASISEWLNQQAPGSVVYVSFGSRNFLSDAQIRELAFGLQGSGKSFIWVLRTPPETENERGSSQSLLPEGFERDTSGRGLVITGWAPQLLILSHPSTGAFISHCGWNSMLESVSRGIPIICWPMAGEQFLNAKWFVEQLRVAVRAQRGDGGVVPREEVERVVRVVLEDEGDLDVRGRVRNLAHVAQAAVVDGGSSAKNWDSFVKHISFLQTSSNESTRIHSSSQES